MIRTNEKHLVQFSLQAQPIYPKSFGWELTHTGVSRQLPSVGGITYNVKVGDPVYGWVADHVEPGVTITADRRDPKSGPNRALNHFACIGNSVQVLTGKAAGKKGVITGVHGGVEHVMVDFDSHTLDKLTEDDKFQIRVHGVGLELIDYPKVSIFSLSPDMLQKMKIQETKSGKLNVPVSAIVPGALMGSGLGSNDIFKGDYDIQTSDPKMLKTHKLDRLRFGDFVAIADHDARFGWSYKTGAVTIGIICHGDSFLAGHGPGVTTLMSTITGEIEPILDPNANISDRLGIGRKRKTKSA